MSLTFDVFGIIEVQMRGLSQEQMKNFIKFDKQILPFTLLAFFIFTATFDVNGQVRVSPTPEQKPKIKVLYPQIKFNRELAEKSLERGTGAVRGTVCVYRKTGGGLLSPTAVFKASEIRISLFPVTPYFEEFQKMRSQNEKNTVVYMSEEAYKYRIDTFTDKNGNFQFTEIKPGRYFLHAIFAFDQIKSREVYVGSGTSGDVTVDYYKWENYRVDATSRLEKMVEVKQDGEILKVDLKKGWGGILSKGCSKAF